MEEENKKIHPLQCAKCSDFMILIIKYVRFEKDNRGVDYLVPFFECPTCGYSKSLRPQEWWQKIAEEDRKDLNEGEYVDVVFKYENKKFPKYDHLGLIYDSIDYYLIPGLSSLDDGYLTPIFFNADVLLYYNNHPQYEVRLSSFSSGSIYFNGERLFGYPFGINRSGHIFFWLGDLEEDFSKPDMEPHLKRFQASNISTDHDIVSKFYFAQIPFSASDAFQDSDNERRLFRLNNDLNLLLQSRLSIKISKLDVLNLSGYYRHPVIEERDQIFSAYLSLNKYIIENIDQDVLKTILLSNGIGQNQLSGRRSIKLLELFITAILKIQTAKELMLPLYVLNDLRQLTGHLSDTSFVSTYNSCKVRLGLDVNASDWDVFKTLIKELIKFHEAIIKSLEA